MTYTLPPSVTGKQVATWYAQQTPARTSWKGLVACPGGGPDYSQSPDGEQATFFIGMWSDGSTNAEVLVQSDRKVIYIHLFRTTKPPPLC